MKKKIIKICLVGKTNAGKSTLINFLVKENISIINKKINTTEELISGIINIKNNQFIFYDTPGINFIYQDKNSRKLKKNLWQGINNCDLILYIIDSRKYNLREIKNSLIKLREVNKTILFIFNKNDIVNKKIILPYISEINKLNICEAFFSISAKKGKGIEAVIKYLTKKTYFSKWIYNENEISNMDDIFMTNECTRNSILTLLHKEIPYNIKIKNLIYKNLKNGDLKIKQEILLNNKRYKKIILGKNGSKIKEIRIRSQKSISKILKTKVHLYLNLIHKNAEEV